MPASPAWSSCPRPASAAPRRRSPPGRAMRRPRCCRCRTWRRPPGSPRCTGRTRPRRFGLGSFKALGGAYAVMKLLQAELARRGVANAATRPNWPGQVQGGDRSHHRHLRHRRQPRPQRRLGREALRRPLRHLRARDRQPGPRDAIAAHGAEIRVVPGTYDDAVRAAQRTAEAEGWFVVSDTSYAGYTEVPRDVMQGYRRDGRGGRRGDARRRRPMSSSRAASAGWRPPSRCRCAPATAPRAEAGGGRAREGRLPAGQRRGRPADRVEGELDT